MLSRYRRLKKRGILSLNQRNSELILPLNQRRLYPIVDNKLATKQLAIAKDIAVPKLYAVLETEQQLKSLKETLAPYHDFVIKPAHGAGGDGIVVINSRLQQYYRKASGALLSTEDLHYHLSQILSGAYSLSGHPDSAIVEQRVEVDDVFSEVSFEGVPDIRIIVYCGFPVMAMLRLPTRMSQGKANLHQGAIGCGIKIDSGTTLAGVLDNRPIAYHPDTLKPIANITIPRWQDMLTIAAKSYELTGLGFLGVDLVLDKTDGPLMLELNARPGLNIQIANNDGLLQRVEKIQQRFGDDSKTTATERIQFCQKSF